MFDFKSGKHANMANLMGVLYCMRHEDDWY